MTHFCENCRNLLDIIIVNDNLSLKCMTCTTLYNAEADDSLRYEETKGGNLMIFQTILNEAVNDAANLREYVTCHKCNHNKAKTVRLGSELRQIHICEKCKARWIKID